MDLATLIGLIGAMVVIVATVVVGGQPTVFVNTPSMIIVLGGTIMVTMMKFSLGQFLSAAKVAVRAFSFKQDTPEELIEKSVELAQAARKGGILSLEEAEIPNEFMQKGLGLAAVRTLPGSVKGHFRLLFHFITTEAQRAQSFTEENYLFLQVYWV